MHELDTELDKETAAFILAATRAQDVVGVEEVQSLWSGYGQVLRVKLAKGTTSSVIAKRVRWPTVMKHPRGWTQSRSHDRKVRSYAVEATFYERYAASTSSSPDPTRTAPCRVPKFLGQATVDDGVLIVLEDLDTAGFDVRHTQVGRSEIHDCLKWLAQFHATFLQVEPLGLWPVGTYWHLDTRPDELAAIDGTTLATAAADLDRRLSSCPYQTFVHGDAKLANFCFRATGSEVAAVDFQYVGGGCGIKDVAYFLSSCLDEDECEQLEAELLDFYFRALTDAVDARSPDVDSDALCAAWRSLYPVAWTDFYRFLAGWSPGHWKAHAYTKRLASEVLSSK